MAEPAEPAVRYARRQDTKFWFEDGTVILVVRHIEFRVYKGILANQSPVFADMFSFSQPPQSTPPCFESSSSTMHVCPFVQLSDSPEDLRHFLRVCMPEQRMHSLFRLPPLSTPSYHMVSALIRLGSKYRMDYLVTDTMDYLKQCYAPKHWQEWAAGRLYDIDAPFQWDHAIGVINLAHLVDEPAILPAALLVCCSLQGEEIVDGFDADRNGYGHCCTLRTRGSGERQAGWCARRGPTREVAFPACADPRGLGCCRTLGKLGLGS
ncbi:hypothetical protein TRAPUB_12732 [Trametes pubescens]|uniref:BTB domain-containing protein n=1 Tax=Trametes pubescens TaxID=154538 RepID=A0A1M2VT09_TRAPU|nr:hypothetical protein TRAPUB_12732 [Trametes pubescens]